MMENPFQDNPPASQDTPNTWTHLCDVSDLPSEDGHYIELENRSFAILRVVPDGEDSKERDERDELLSDDEIAKHLRVMDDRCPHAGASLSAGHIDEGCIICPWHHWAFDVNNGVCPDADVYKVRTYEVRVVDGRVEAMI